MQTVGKKNIEENLRGLALGEEFLDLTKSMIQKN